MIHRTIVCRLRFLVVEVPRLISSWMAGVSRRLHRDQNGSISITSVFFVIFFAMVLGMVMNISRHADRKVIMQNGADAATYSGGIVLSRSMNTLAFTNHLLCDVFALTAYLREARDRNSEEFATGALQEWVRLAPRFLDAPVQKFSQLTDASPGHARLEQDLINVFATQSESVSQTLLPVLEEILAQEMIPEFQRALVLATPHLANQAANEFAERHAPETAGLAGDDAMHALMWRTDAQPFDSDAEFDRSTLPVADPVFDSSEFRLTYFQNAVSQRRQLSHFYLNSLNNRMFRDFDRVAKMSQYANFWRGFSRGYLDELLAEYPDRNLPMQLRESVNREFNRDQYLHDEYMFVGVGYWSAMSDRLPGLFTNPRDADDTTFAQIRLFIPRARLVYDPTRPPPFQISRQFRVQNRDLLNQDWAVQIVPATSAAIPTILETPPPQINIDLPGLGGISVEEFRRINTH